MSGEKRTPARKARPRRRDAEAAVARGEAARVWRRDVAADLEKLISEADSASARAADAARAVVVARKPKGRRA